MQYEAHKFSQDGPAGWMEARDEPTGSVVETNAFCRGVKIAENVAERSGSRPVSDWDESSAEVEEENVEEEQKRNVGTMEGGKRHKADWSETFLLETLRVRTVTTGNFG